MKNWLKYIGVFFYCLALISCEVGEKINDAFQIIEDKYNNYALYTPDSVNNILVVIPDYPWKNEAEAINKNTEHITNYSNRWQNFADSNHFLLIVPSMGIRNFKDYQHLFGSEIDADAYVNQLVDSLGNAIIPAFDGKFYLYGHAEGGEFASRFVLKHPEKIHQAILSAPNTLPLPDNDIEYPYGMKPIVRPKQLDEAEETREMHIPNPLNWMKAAANIPIVIVIGAEDKERQTPAPGQLGNSRLARAGNWLDKMNSFALVNDQKPSEVSIVLVENVGDNVELLMPKAQKSILEQLNKTEKKVKDIDKAPY